MRRVLVKNGRMRSLSPLKCREAGWTEADVTAPTDPVSVEPMTECYDATRAKKTPHRPCVGGRNDWMLQR